MVIRNAAESGLQQALPGIKWNSAIFCFFTRCDRTEWTVRANSEPVEGNGLMIRKHRFDVWVIVREGNVVTQYLSEREASRYVNARNRNQSRPAFQTILAIAEVEVTVPDSIRGET